MEKESLCAYFPRPLDNAFDEKSVREGSVESTLSKLPQDPSSEGEDLSRDVKEVEKTSSKEVKSEEISNSEKNGVEDKGSEKEASKSMHFSVKDGKRAQKRAKEQNSIEREVARLWRPPPGLAGSVECVVKFSIDASGQVDSFEIVKPSGVLIYDLSIARVAKRFCFEKCLWGRDFTVDFYG
ncbi:TonB C-terminal domain-containing protein [Candidatus Dependentiae bacterium]